jgi:purine-binding chemotaxis protein CheW
MPPIDTSLLNYGCVIGTANLRGETIPIVDFRSFIGPEPVFNLDEVTLAKRKLLVIQTDGGLLGLMVYSINSIIPFFKSDVLPFAKLALPRGDLVKGCLVGESDELVMLLDHAKLASDPGLVEPAQTCREVHNTKGNDVEQTETSRLQERRTFIVFSIDRSFAMDTRQVSEVINKPETMTAPPFAMDYVEGIINLRGELITLVNLRRLYGADVCEKAEQKVVIFTDDAQKFAILVDSVDEMVTTTADKITTNSWKTNAETEDETEDVSGFLECTRADGGAHLIMIMDGSALIKRCARSGD